MTWYLFGQAPADYTISAGADNQATLEPNADLEGWSDRDSGTKYTLALDTAGTPADSWTSDSVGRPGPVYAQVPQMWVSANGGARVLMTASDFAGQSQAQIDAILASEGQPNGLATLGDDGKVPASQIPPGSGGGATTLDGLTDVDAANPSDGDVLSQDLSSGTWINRSFMETMSKSAPLTVGVLTEPLMKIIQDHVPDAAEPNTMEFWSTYSGTPKMVGWMNERGLYRGEQVPGGTGWENPFVAIVNVAGTGYAFKIDRRESNNSRTTIGGFDHEARPITSLQAWTAITSYGGSNYTASTSDWRGTYDALAVRMDTDDVVRMRGIVAYAAGVSGADVIFTLPSGFAPSKTRVVNIASSAGKSFGCTVNPDGTVIVTASPNLGTGSGTMYFDGITYVK